MASPSIGLARVLSAAALASILLSVAARQTGAAALTAADSLRLGIPPPPAHVWNEAQSASPPIAPAPRPAGVQVDDGSWSIISPPLPLPPTPDQHVGIFDTAHNRMVVSHGDGLGNTTWALDLASLTWSQIAAANSPSQRWGATAIYDPVADRLIMFGGYADLQYSSELWILPLHGPPTWIKASQPVGLPWPAGRLFQSAIYDPLRYRMIVFGGEDGPNLNDTWVLDLSTLTWSQLATAGTTPSARYGHSAVYDPAADEMIVYGGYGGEEDGTYALSLGSNPTWRTIVATGGAPAWRTYHTAVFDTRQERMIIHAGIGNGFPSDTWQLTTGANPAWTPLQPGGAPAVARRLHNAIYDETNARMIVFGGLGTGDLRQLQWSLATAGPQIYRLDPPAGMPGDTVTIRGLGLSNPLDVQFNGLSASIVSSTNYALEVVVPSGNPGGPVTVTLATQTLTSPADFVVVMKPVVDSATPLSGGVGTSVEILGSSFAMATRVSFGPGSHATFTVVSDQKIIATVDAEAQTGPITVYTPYTSGASSFDFTVVHHAPVISSVTPTHGPVGIAVVIAGQFFTSVNRVSFGASGQAIYIINSDIQLIATVDANAVSGPISITNIDGTTSTTFSFQVDVPSYAPQFVSVRDAPNDQGGKVILEWLASGYDIAADHSVQSYRIWRRAPLFGSSALPARAMRLASAPAGFWEPIGEVPAARFPGYAFTALTLQDSLPDSNPYTAFVIQPLTGDAGLIVYSDPDSGYSVDNLAPPIPSSFAASYGSAITSLHWTLSRAPDFAEFMLYRGASADFVPSASNLVIATNDTNFVDVAGSSTYKLAAIDIHGNHSKYAVVSPMQPVAVLAALTFVDPEPDRIRLTWYAAGEPNLNATLYRRTPGTDWTRVATLTSNSGGLLQYEDRAVIEGGLYGYRLGIMDAGVEVFAGEVWATASRPALALEGILPNPAVNGRFSVAFALPTNEPARLELLDVTGRRVASREVGSLGPGRHQLALDSGAHLPPGVYLVRLVQAQTTRTARVVVIE
jgi:hypothetical protein